MGLTVLSVAFPFAPIGPDPVGGAEQVLARLDHALAAGGHRSIVLAPEGSRVAGELVPLPACPGEIGEAERARIHAAVRDRLGGVLARERIDVVHLHGLDFDSYLPPPGPPVMVTLHLPLAWYAPTALPPRRPRTWLHPVSASQAALAPEDLILAPVIENGVDLDLPPARKKGFALALGRICPEKGFEDALEAAARAETPLLIAGTVFPYRAHQDYFRREILPRLGRGSRWVGSVAGARKRRLLAEARCLLVPSKAPETSSLVAMEALAAGTPVIAYRAGALSEIVEEGRTGFLVEGVAEMAEAIRAVDGLAPGLCRRRAEERFSLERMVAIYLERYAQLAAA